MEISWLTPMVERPDVSKEIKGAETITDAMMYLKNDTPLLIAFRDNNEAYSRFPTDVEWPECNRLRFFVGCVFKLNDLRRLVAQTPLPTVCAVLSTGAKSWVSLSSVFYCSSEALE